MGAVAYLIARMLSRRCGKCGWRQLVPRAKRRDHVVCERCLETIPPKPNKNKKASAG